MKRALCVALVMIVGLAASIPVRADVTTVILEDQTKKAFDVKPGVTERTYLRFNVSLPPTPGAKVKECSLRVVPTPSADSSRRADQDVFVHRGYEPTRLGGWSAYGNTPKPYVVPLQPNGCLPSSGPYVILTLYTESMYTAWTYHGSGASVAADRPRLIVTYDSPGAASSPQVNTWTYKEPTSFFSSTSYKLTSGTLLANPISYDGAVYLVAGSSSGRRLHRVHGAGNIADWALGFEITPKSFAFVTSQGRLQLITKDAILSCDLRGLEKEKTAGCNEAKIAGGLTVNEKEVPAMGADGSLYFKNVQAGGSIVAFNPLLREIWTTQLKLTDASPIALSSSGRYAYVLANVSSDGARRMLLRIDTAAGETTAQEFAHCPSGPKACEYPALQTLLRPVVVTKIVKGGPIDYVFVAGNTSDKGYLQLVSFGTHAKPGVAWTERLAKPVSAAPAVSDDGDALYIASGDTISRYAWYGPKGPSGSSGSPPNPESATVKANISALLLDRGGSVYTYTDRGLHTYQSSRKEWSKPQLLGFTPTLQFTPDGALIGYTANALYDLSPKTEALTVSAFDTETIYSADRVTVAAGAVAKAGDRIVVRGKSITFQNGFRWPVGATLHVQHVQ